VAAVYSVRPDRIAIIDPAIVGSEATRLGRFVVRVLSLMVSGIRRVPALSTRAQCHVGALPDGAMRRSDVLFRSTSHLANSENSSRPARARARSRRRVIRGIGIPPRAHRAPDVCAGGAPRKELHARRERAASGVFWTGRAARRAALRTPPFSPWARSHAFPGPRASPSTRRPNAFHPVESRRAERPPARSRRRRGPERFDVQERMVRVERVSCWERPR
jgi:hypothetical protein